jgi:hypothetical protein
MHRLEASALRRVAAVERLKALGTDQNPAKNMADKCPRVYRLTETESFMPFNGSMKELKEDPTFEHLIGKGRYSVIRRATYCSRADDGGVHCRRGVAVTSVRDKQ